MKPTDNIIPVPLSEYLLPKDKINLYISFLVSKIVNTASKPFGDRLVCLLKVSCQNTCIQSILCQKWTQSGLFSKQTIVIIVSKPFLEIIFYSKLQFLAKIPALRVNTVKIKCYQDNLLSKPL